jgi:hypothetical protein
MSGNAIWLPANLLALVNCKAVVLVLCNTLVLYCKTLACGACMHALTASLYLQSKVADWSSMNGNAIWLPANKCMLQQFHMEWVSRCWAASG